MLGVGQVQCFIVGDQVDNFGVVFYQFVFGKGEGVGEVDVEVDCFQGINVYQVQIEFFFQFVQIYGYGFVVDGVGVFVQQMLVVGYFDQ